MPSKRLYARYPCDWPATVHSGRGVKLAEGRLHNLSQGGAAFEAPAALERGVSYLLRFQGIELGARVTWIGPRDPKDAARRRYGLQFVITTQQEALLKPILDGLRRALQKEGPESPRDYWSV